MAQTNLVKQFGAIASSLVAAFAPMVAANANAQVASSPNEAGKPILLRNNNNVHQTCVTFNDLNRFLDSNGFRTLAILNYDASKMPPHNASGGQILTTNAAGQTLTIGLNRRPDSGQNPTVACQLSDPMGRFIRPVNPNDYAGINDLFTYTRSAASCLALQTNNVSQQPYIPFEIGIQQKIDQGFSMLGYSEWNVRVTSGNTETKYAMFFYKAATGEVVEAEAGYGCITDLTYNRASRLNPERISYEVDLSARSSRQDQIAQVQPR